MEELTSMNRGRAGPRSIIGDFNDILCQGEKEGLHPKPREQREAFREFVDANEVTDIDLKGGKFTWFNDPRNGFVTKERLDNALVNWEWRSIHHSAIFIDDNKYFKYEVFWEDHENCKMVIRKGWETDAVEEYNWESLKKRIGNCKKELTTWSQRVFKRADKEISRLKEDVANLQQHDLNEEAQKKILEKKNEIS